MDSNNNFQDFIRQEIKKIAEQTGTSVNDINNNFYFWNRNNAIDKSAENFIESISRYK